MSDNSVSLKLDRSLINPQFDGYKLSLDPLPNYRLDLDKGVGVISLSEDQYSFQHAKVFGLHNHLFGDPWNPNYVYWIDDCWNVRKACVAQETQLEPASIVFTIPLETGEKPKVNPALHFTSSHWAVLTDGSGKLYLLETSDRSAITAWKVAFSDSLLSNGEVYNVIHSGYHSQGATPTIDCVLVYVVEHEQTTSSSPFLTCLQWITLKLGETGWSVYRTRTLRGSSAPDYVAVEPSGQAVYIAAQKPFRMTYDSMKPVEEPKEQAVNGNNSEESPVYRWTQTPGDLSLHLVVPEGTSKSDIDYHLAPDRVKVGIKNAEPLLNGSLYDRVDVEGSTWTIANNRLEVELCKVEPEMWPHVVDGDTRGEMIIEEDTVPAATQSGEGGDDKPFNAQQLEECDAFPDEASGMMRIHGDSHLVTHRVNLGSHQWLFNAALNPEKMPSICLRHDVDGIVWQPLPGEEEPNPWHHTATFNALGYVKASKEQNRFSSCPPNTSYVVLCDCVRHAYVYRQQSQIVSPLRNRKTGQEVTAVAKQQVIALETTDSILGLYTSNDKVVILTNKLLHVIKVN